MFKNKHNEMINLIKNTLKNKNTNISLNHISDILHSDQLISSEFYLIFYNKKYNYKILKLTIISHENGMNIISKHHKLLLKIKSNNDDEFILINKFIEKLSYHCLTIYNFYINIIKYYKINLENDTIDIIKLGPYELFISIDNIIMLNLNIDYIFNYELKNGLNAYKIFNSYRLKKIIYV